MGSPTPSVASFASASPAPRSKKPVKKQSSFTAPKQVKKSMPFSSPGAGPSGAGAGARPGPRPLSAVGAEDESSRRSAGASASDSFLLTAAERRKIEARDEKREGEEIFSFLRDVRDAAGRRPDDPEYDKRTIFIPNKVFESLKPFEKQFWSIKRDHYDTVLFFQKGKFYELYEDDAMIGHQEFDLKLTDRVRMKMVGVPEQSFEMWAAKFLAAGYKVGKVEQCETAIGAEMRGKAEGKDKGPSNAKEDKIVRRELAQVFTNGTIVDSTYLTTDEANHCVAIKEMATSSSTSAFGVCVMDASTGEFGLSAFDDDVCRTRLETMFRQIRPKEFLHAKVSARGELVQHNHVAPGMPQDMR
jgi:DNA mismatch repair protein MSH6